MDREPEPGLPSPCTKVCVYDATLGYCVGCFRSLAEIAGWGSGTEAYQRAALEACERRRRGHERASGV